MEDAENLQGNLGSRTDITDGSRLACPLCFKDFVTPRILPCMDTFCHRCLTSFLRQSAPKRNIYGFFECPVCTTLIYVPVQEKGARKWASMFPLNTSILRFTAYGGHKQLDEIEKGYNSSMIDVEGTSDRNSSNTTTTTSPKTNHEASSSETAAVQNVATEEQIANKDQKEITRSSTLTGTPETQDIIKQSISGTPMDIDVTTSRTDKSFDSSVTSCKVCSQTSCKGCTHSVQSNNGTILENIDSKMENSSSLPSCFHQLFKCAEHYGRVNNYLCHDHGVVCCVRCKSRHRRCEKFTKLAEHIGIMMKKTSSRDMLMKLFQVEEDFSKLVEINELNLQVFHGQIRDMPHEISRLEGRINEVLYDSLWIKMKKEGSDVFNGESERKLEEIRKCRSVVASIRMCTNILEIVNNIGTMEELFLVVNKLEQKLLKYKEEMDRIVSQMRIVELNFRLNPVIRDFMALDENEMLQLQVKEESQDESVKGKVKANEKVNGIEAKSGVKSAKNAEPSSKFNLPPLSDKTDRSVKGRNNKKNVNMQENLSLPQLSVKSTDKKTNTGKQSKPISKSSHNKLTLDKNSQNLPGKNTKSKKEGLDVKSKASYPNETADELEINDDKQEIPFKIEILTEFMALTPINYDGQSRFTGATFLPDDQLLLVDSENCRCCLYDSSCLFISVHYLPFPPQSVCYVSKEKVAVAVPTHQVIQMLRVKMEMDERERIHIDFRCWAVAVLNSNQLAISGFTEETGVCCWGIYTTKGKKIHYQELEKENNGGGTTHIAVNQSKTIIYISFSAIDSVYSFVIDGNLKFIYFNTELKSPHGVDVDGRDLLFVLGWTSQNLHIVSPEGICLKVLKKVIPVTPRQIAFNQSKDKFIVTHGKHFSEDCFILSVVEKEDKMKTIDTSDAAFVNHLNPST